MVMTIPEAAKTLGISRGLAYQLAGRDELPVKVIKCGRRLLVSRQALYDLLSNKNGKLE